MKNILFIMTDQQRADQSGANGFDMPNIDALESYASFHCVTGNPICTPARCSLLTGRYARQVGMVTMSGDLDHQIPTMPQALQKVGYRTYGVGKFHFLQTWPWGTGLNGGWDFVKNQEAIRRFGFDFVWETAGKQQIIQNYDFYCHYLDRKGLLDGYRDFIVESGGGNGDIAAHNYDKANPFPYDEEDYVDTVTGRIAREQLEKHPADQPFYMFVSFCGPHKPYDPPKRYLDMFPIERKDDFVLEPGQTLTEDEKETVYRQRRAAKAMLKLIDDQIGEILDLLKRRGMYDDTLIVFTSDHGDMLGDHALIQKGVPWKQVTDVPLYIKLPGAPRVGRLEAPVELTDVTATILDYVGLDHVEVLSRPWPAYNNRIPGRPLTDMLTGKAERVRDFVFSESDFTEERDGVYCTYSPEEYQQVRGRGRSTAWQMIADEQYKYIKYLNYTAPGAYHEELYDLVNNPDETLNIAQKADNAAIMRKMRDRLMYVLDVYQPAQKTWTDSKLEQMRHTNNG